MDNNSNINSVFDFVKNKKLEADVFLNLDSNTIIKIKEVIQIIKKDSFKNTKEKGDALENLISLLFQDKFFIKKANIKSNTNEIDLLLYLTDEAKIYKSIGIIPDWFPNNHFVLECKNYKDKVGVTYIGKFATLMKTHNSPIGIFVTNKEITGEKDGKYSWADASGLVKKINLKYSESPNPIYIIPINFQQIENNIDKYKGNIFELLSQNKLKIDLDLKTDF